MKIILKYEHCNSRDDYQKPVDNLKKEDFFSRLKNHYPSDGELEKKQKNILKN